jgi:short-subunit dehydrogenase
VRRGAGRVLITSSIAADLPGTYQATYNASKSFLQSFALAVRTELKDTGVTVTSLMPGPTDTPLFDRAPGMAGTLIAKGPKDDPAEVAEAGFDAMMAGRERAVAASLRTRIEHWGSRLLPDAVKAQLNRVMAAQRFSGS